MCRYALNMIPCERSAWGRPGAEGAAEAGDRLVHDQVLHYALSATPF